LNGSAAVIDLLVEWDEQRQAGKHVSPEQLCPGDPAMQTELRQRIARREQLLGIFEMPTLGASETAAALPPLPQVAGYELLEVLGRGGMGVVYKARQLGLNRVVALKMILAGANASPQDLSRLRAEAEAVAQLAHPNIVQIYEIGEQGGCPFLALEYVSDGSLAQHLDGTPLSPKQAAETVLALARAVHHAHEKGIVHRDLKPANVLLADGVPKIADFGLAKRADSNQAHTLTGTILGSPSYMAPEQAAGQTDKIGPATDVYALGVILYEMLTGRPPFKGSTLLETIDQVREHDPVPPRYLLPKTPRDLETICLKCLEKSPQRRYASAAALADDLRSFLHGEPINAQSLTLLDQVARTISHHTFDARFRGMANWMALSAPIPITVHVIAYWLLAGQPYYALGMVATTTAMVFTVLPTLLLFGVPTLRLIPAWQRKHFVTVWVGHLSAMALTLFAVLVSVPTGNAVLLIYPIWASVAGLSFLSHATEAGIYYMVAGLLFAFAVVMALTPYWAPLEVAFFMSANMTAQALYLRRLSAEPPPAQPLGAHAATTIKGGA